MRTGVYWLAAIIISVAPQTQVHARDIHQDSHQDKRIFDDKFRQLEEILPTPGETRAASGAPGHHYWQQQTDYKIKVELDESKRTITGTAIVTYTNNSPDTLHYLWLQLDQNGLKPNSDMVLATPAKSNARYTFQQFQAELAAQNFPGGYHIHSLKGENGANLSFSIVQTMLRIDLEKPLEHGQSMHFSIGWFYNIPEQKILGGRAGYEFFPDDGNHIFQIAQWFPRLAAYTDVNGWTIKPLLGTGEYTLEFGNYEVAITVPANHIVSATGALQNPDDVLSAVQKSRLDHARTADKPVSIITPSEAAANERNRSARKATWIFKADNVRDFAFASSAKFIWDAWGHAQKDGPFVMAMSFYPKEATPLWDKYSTHAIRHALDQYTQYTIPYPYPTAQSVNGPVGGMEYPMISFNGPRPDKGKDGRLTYSKKTKYDLISIIFHEVGHNYFPMIVNSDERHWGWMDEGLTSFLQYLTEQAWEENYPSTRGVPRDVTTYMKSNNQTPIMTNSDSVTDIGPVMYGKPSAALTILRETILGRDVFDYAFREYARRWAFKRPMPADFFRTMEDASGIDLDWFWRGWFYTTDHVDISIDNLRRFRIDSKNPDIEKAWERTQQDSTPQSITALRNKDMKRRVDAYPELKDFYNSHDDHTVTGQDKTNYANLLADLTDLEQATLKKSDMLYIIDFSNIGGLVMPIILDIEYSDGSREEKRFPAEIWRRNSDQVSKLLIVQKEIRRITLDPHWETADTDTDNNDWPRKPGMSRLEITKPKADRNLMKEMNVSVPQTQ